MTDRKADQKKPSNTCCSDSTEADEGEELAVEVRGSLKRKDDWMCGCGVSLQGWGVGMRAPWH